MRIQFFQDLIDFLRKKKNNQSRTIPEEIIKNNNILIPSEKIPKISLFISGTNNTVDLRNLKINGTVEIFIYGDNNKIIFQENTSVGDLLKIRIGNVSKNFGKANNTELIIGKNTSFGSAEYTTYNCNAKCIIGDNCMFAFGIQLFNTDAHPVFDFSSGAIINKVKGITIGEHCWIGANSTILKNTVLAEDTIIGWGSVVSGKHTVSHCALAGNPAKIVKENITWNKDGSNGYVQNEY